MYVHLKVLGKYLREPTMIPYYIDWQMKIWVDTTWLVEIPRYVYTCKVGTVQTVAGKKTENCHKILITKLSGRIHSTVPYKVIVLNTSNLIPHNITHTLVWLFLSYNNGDSHAQVRLGDKLFWVHIYHHLNITSDRQEVRLGIHVYTITPTLHKSDTKTGTTNV